MNYTENINQLKLVREKTNIPCVKINNTRDASDFCRNFYHDDLTIYESFFLILLNQANKTIGYVKISQGGIVGTVVDVRIIAKYAIESLATAVILCHNHPSGNLSPSIADKRITENTIKALALFDVKVLDHIILTEESYISFKDEGLI